MRMEHVIYTFLRFSMWALEGAVMLPPFAVASAFAAINLIGAGIKQRPFKRRLWKAHHWLVTSHFLFFIAAIAVAVFGANPIMNPTISHPAIPAAEKSLDLVIWLSIVSCVFWIWQMKGFRWFAASLMLLAQVVTWSALFVAGMSISGDWL